MATQSAAERCWRATLTSPTATDADKLRAADRLDRLERRREAKKEAAKAVSSPAEPAQPSDDGNDPFEVETPEQAFWNNEVLPEAGRRAKEWNDGLRTGLGLDGRDLRDTGLPGQRTPEDFTLFPGVGQIDPAKGRDFYLTGVPHAR